MSEQRRGLVFGVAAYGLWGLFPLYWPHLKPASPGEILAHRILWSLIVVVSILAARRSTAVMGTLANLGRMRLTLLAVAAVVVSINWGTYIYGVNAGEVVQTSLGYFINPLVTIGLGVVVLGERLRPTQWAAIGIATLAIGVLTVDYGRPPWLALILAFSFGAYGLLKKKAAVDAVESLTVETGVLLLPALLFLAILSASGHSTFTSHGSWHAVGLVGAGVVTAVPLLFFGAAANRVPLSTIGLLQYLAPILQFIIGVTVDHEKMPASRYIGFGLVWIALVVLTVDALHSARRRQLERVAEAVSI